MKKYMSKPTQEHKAYIEVEVKGATNDEVARIIRTIRILVRKLNKEKKRFGYVVEMKDCQAE